MSIRNSRDELPPLPARLPIGGLTSFGLLIAGAGWVFLIVAMLLGSAMGTAMPHDNALVAVIAMRADIITVAQTAILSGFALAAIGVLRSGFGILNRFFEAVLDRSTASRAEAPSTARTETLKPEPLKPEPIKSASAKPLPVEPIVVEAVIDDEPPPPIVPNRERFTRSAGGAASRSSQGSASASSVQKRKQNYVILSDGSVEVETLLGTRVFATLDEAKDFIRG